MGEVEPKVYGGGGGRSWTNRTRIRKVLLVLPRLLSFFPCFSRFSRVEIKGERKEKKERERKFWRNFESDLIEFFISLGTDRRSFD